MPADPPLPAVARRCPPLPAVARRCPLDMRSGAENISLRGVLVCSLLRGARQQRSASGCDQGRRGQHRPWRWRTVHDPACATAAKAIAIRERGEAEAAKVKAIKEAADAEMALKGSEDARRRAEVCTVRHCFRARKPSFPLMCCCLTCSSLTSGRTAARRAGPPAAIGRPAHRRRDRLCRVGRPRTARLSFCCTSLYL